MPQRNLRVVKRTPIAIGICKSCNMQFGSHQPIEDDAEAEMSAAFDAHKCNREHASQAAARIVQEAVDYGREAEGWFAVSESRSWRQSNASQYDCNVSQ